MVADCRRVPNHQKPNLKLRDEKICQVMAKMMKLKLSKWKLKVKISEKVKMSEWKIEGHFMSLRENERDVT